MNLNTQGVEGSDSWDYLSRVDSISSIFFFFSIRAILLLLLLFSQVHSPRLFQLHAPDRIHSLFQYVHLEHKLYVLGTYFTDNNRQAIIAPYQLGMRACRSNLVQNLALRVIRVRQPQAIMMVCSRLIPGDIQRF